MADTTATPATATLGERARSQIPRVVVAPDPDEPDRYERSPAAVLRLVAAVVGLLLVVAWARLLPRTHTGLEDDLQSGAGTWAEGLGTLADAIATGWSLLVIVVTVGAALVTRRPRQLLTAALGAGMAAGLIVMAARIAGASPGVITGREWQLVVVAAAIATAAASFSVFATPAARWSTGIIGVFTVIGVLSADISLASRLMVVLTGEAVGALVAVVFGSASRQVTRTQLRAALGRARLPVESLERHGGDARGSQPWLVTLATGRTVFVKVEATDQLRATQLFRIWRRIRLKEHADERAPSSVRRSAEHEAFVAERAQAAGVRTPTVISIGLIDDDRGVFTVFDAIHGTSFDEISDLGDAALRSAWSQIQVLRRAGIAHRDLRAANLMCVDDDVWVIDFGFAEVAADDALLDRDVAEFLASSAAIVGSGRAVDAAVAVLGADTVAEAIPWIQPLACSTATRSALTKDEFADLRERVREASGLRSPELPQVQRVTLKAVLVTAALGLAVWTLLPQLTSGIDWSSALEASRGWMVAAVVASFVTYLGAAVSVAGSVSDTPPLPKTVVAQLASSFTNRIAPAKVGGLALNVRYLTAQGIDGAVAAAGLALSTLVGTIAHVVITLVVVLWAGTSGMPEMTMPPAWVGVAALAALAAAALVLAVVPPARRWWSTSAVPAVRRSGRSLLAVLRSPRNLAMLAGGSSLVTIANLVAFVVSMRAFGITTSFAVLGTVYLAGSALASAAPTPGGLGATEAALVAGLSVVGVASNEAIPAVLLFRLATFWLPILPGWWSMVWLQRRGDL